MEKIELISLLLTLLWYVLAVFFLLAAAIFSRKSSPSQKGEKGPCLSRLGTWSIVAGFLFNSAALIIRYYRTGHPPMGNMYEFLLLFVWGIILVYLIVEFKYQVKQIGIFALPLAIALIFWLITMDKGSVPLMPALRSDWLYFHVFTAVVSYGAFAIAFVLGIMYLLKEKTIDNGIQSDCLTFLPQLGFLDELSYKLIVIGMSFLTLVIVTGAIWAESAWGTYWSWDPKETWSLITWFIYAGYLHARFLKEWRGKRSVMISVLGFLAVMFTFAGVNLVLPGLHSYV